MEALAQVIAEQKINIEQLELENDMLANKAQRYMTQFEMCNDALREVSDSNRILKEEITYLNSQLSLVHEDAS
jgi:cell division protein FtsB